MENVSAFSLVADVVVVLKSAAIGLLVKATATSMIPSAPSRFLETEYLVQTVRLTRTSIANPQWGPLGIPYTSQNAASSLMPSL